MFRPRTALGFSNVILGNIAEASFDRVTTYSKATLFRKWSLFRG